MKEADLQQDIIKYLRLVGIFCWVNHSVGKMPSGRYVNTLSGISDILGIIPSKKNGRGVFLAIEVKKKEGYASKSQLEFIDKINEKGGLAFVARSIEDVSDKLKVFL